MRTFANAHLGKRSFVGIITLLSRQRVANDNRIAVVRSTDAYANSGDPEHFCYDADSRLTDYGFGGTACKVGTACALEKQL